MRTVGCMSQTERSNEDGPPREDGEFAVRMENITKRFPGIVANQDVHLRVFSGSFHAVIGENGAGKSTLLNILYGRHRPDTGRIFLRGEEVTGALHGPADAIRRGIGLVSQHYALIPALSVLENVILGSEPVLPGGVLNLRVAGERIRQLAMQLEIGAIDLNMRADRLSVAAQQKVEILKAFYRGASLLLLDEPTATLAPQEANTLFQLLTGLVARGATILFVTHKLREVMAHSDYVTVLRAGRNLGDFRTGETTPAELLQRMIGARSTTGVDLRMPLHAGPLSAVEAAACSDELLPATVAEVPPQMAASPLLQVENVSVRNARRVMRVHSVSLEVGKGEIVGVAGVDGSGQRELAEAIVGVSRCEAGRLFLAGVDITSLGVRSRQRMGVSYIPEDRHRSAVVLDFSLAENFLLGHERQPEWGGGRLLDYARMVERAAGMILRYDVRVGAQGAATAMRSLSGGNQQKVVVARAMESAPRLLVACQPTRGLDVEASRFVYRTLISARESGLGVLLFSLDLDEIFQLADRIAVMFNGRIAGIMPRGRATPENIGALMTGASGTAPQEAS